MVGVTTTVPGWVRIRDQKPISRDCSLASELEQTAPYNNIGLINESKSAVVFALQDIFARLIVPFRPKKNLIAFVFRVDWANLRLPDLSSTIPR